MKNADEALALLRHWKHMLELDDWDIQLRINVSAAELEDAHGTCEYTTSIKSARIDIIDLQDVDKVVEPDLEITLVHELLHIKFALAWDSTDTTVIHNILHQYIDSLAHTLVSVKRCKSIERRLEVRDWCIERASGKG